MFKKYFQNDTGQNVVEYLLLFTAVLIILLLSLSKEGFLTKVIQNSMDLTVDGIELMANSVDTSSFVE